MNSTTSGHSTLSESQRATLAARLRRGRTDGPAAIPRRSPGVTELPLSFAQEQLWFIDQFHSLPTYNIPGLLRLRGPLDTGALARSIDDLVERHEALRTRLQSNSDGRPIQLIDPPSSTELPLLDLSSVPAGHAQAQLRQLAERDAMTPFDLATGPLFRRRLVKLSDTDHALLIVLHHTVFDGWSFGVLLHELAALYGQEVTGEPAGLTELPVQFADYALWEQHHLGGPALEELLDFWKKTLQGFETAQMPTDRPRPVVASHDGAIERLDAGSELVGKLRAMSRRESTTPFVVLMAALQALMHRYTGQTDIVVGTASANRTRTELAPLIGFLVNTLPIRTDLAGDPTFEELVSRVRDTTLAAYTHQDLPFAKLVDALRVERDTSRAPIFQVGLTYAEAAGAMQMAEVSMDLELVDLMAAKFDLNFFIEVRDGKLSLEVSYPPVLYDPETVRRTLGHLEVLLNGVVDDPTRRLSELPMLTDAELHSELVAWNDTAADFPVTCIHQRFEWAVEQYPDAIAAKLGDDQATYAELNVQANQIARRLVELGVGPEGLVGVSMQPSVRRLAVLLGIMKAGGGYVPLDPDLPGDRLSFMVEDAAMPVVVADAASEANLPQTAATIVTLDAEWAELGTRDGANLDVAVQPSNVAYVIYTSGSTGRPKGVVVEHRHALNFLLGMIEHWNIGPGDRVQQFASLNFDVSVMDMFMTVLSGATLILADRETLLSPPRLGDLLRSEKVTFCCMPPAVVNLLTGQDFPDLRVLLSAGEELSAELVKSWLRPGLHFYNGYGPTEAAIGATFGEMDGTSFPPPIGRPKPNYQVYVLDSYLNPVPVGVVGELHIGGAGVTRGYLNRPELTAERFIDDPFSDESDARLYKTGDLVRRLPDGNIVFIGRIDGQIKIRGLRVELGEIETALTAHPGVLQAVVTVIEDRVGEKQLAGYVRLDEAYLRSEGDITQADLRQHLALLLPSYMVPTHLMVLDSFLLTSNKKIDKAALPHPAEVESEDTHVEPTTLIETVLVDMYGTLLNLDRVGIEDSFFDVGGSSLQAMQLVTRLRNDLAVDVDVTAIFLAPNPRQLAALLCDKYGLEDAELGEDGIDGLTDEEVLTS
ncbi:MAG: amino acid adenylation domain-containing protein [Actinomycetota bacterium]|nr:amino acid adenylation domain-containing protein [Actinomycetota bacterium]